MILFVILKISQSENFVIYANLENRNNKNFHNVMFKIEVKNNLSVA